MKAEVKNEPGGDFDGRVPPLHGYEDSLSQYSDSGQSSSGLPGNGQGNMSTDMSAAFMQNIQGGNNSAGFNDPGGQWTDQQQPYPTSVTRVNKDGSTSFSSNPGGGWPSPGGAQGWNQGGQGQQGSGNNMALNQMMAAGNMNIPQGSGDMVSRVVLSRPSDKVFAGDYGFELGMGVPPRESKSTPWTYSSITNKLFARMSVLVPI